MARPVARRMDSRGLSVLEMEWEEFDQPFDEGIDGVSLMLRALEQLDQPAQAEAPAAVRRRQLEALRAATQYRPPGSGSAQEMEAG